MKRRLHAALVIARRQAFETLLSPGLYVTLALGLLLGFFLVNGFAASIDSAGFNPTINPLYDLLGRSLAGAFGAAFVGKLFAEGPFLFALVVAFLPVFLFLAISSVFRFGQEKSAGAVELLAYGPADGTSYIIASFLKDIAFTAGSLALIAAFLWVGAALGNLVLGPLFLASLPVLFALSLAVFAYGILCSVLSANASSALAAFLGILLVFLLVTGGVAGHRGRLGADRDLDRGGRGAVDLPLLLRVAVPEGGPGGQRRRRAGRHRPARRPGRRAARRRASRHQPQGGTRMKRLLASLLLLLLPLASALAEVPVRTEQLIWSVLAFNGRDYSPAFAPESSDTIYLLAGADNFLSARKTLRVLVAHHLGVENRHRFAERAVPRHPRAARPAGNGHAEAPAGVHLLQREGRVRAELERRHRRGCPRGAGEVRRAVRVVLQGHAGLPEEERGLRRGAAVAGRPHPEASRGGQGLLGAARPDADPPATRGARGPHATTSSRPPRCSRPSS